MKIKHIASFTILIVLSIINLAQVNANSFEFSGEWENLKLLGDKYLTFKLL